MRGREDAIALLKQDHREVEALFERFEAATALRDQQRIAADICDALRLHAEMEEQIFYPAIRAALDEDTPVDEAEVEHDTAEYLIDQIESDDLDPGHFRASVIVLKEYVAHHVRAEEAELFRRARASGLDLDALGDAISARKSERV